MNKITKLLSVFIIAGAIGTGIAGVAGCKGGGDDGGSGGGGGGDTCQHTTVRHEDNNDGATHKVICTDECKETINASEGHTDANEDGVCDKCEGDVVVASAKVTIDNTVAGSVTAGETLTLSATVTGVDGNYTVEWEITAGGTLATISGSTLTAGNTAGDVTIVAKVKVGGEVKATSVSKTIGIRAASIYDTLKASADKIYGNEFETDAAKLPDFTSFGTAGIYGLNATDARYTKVDGGVAKLITDDQKETVAIVDFGTDIKDTIEGYVEVTIQTDTGNSWSFLRIVDDSSTPSEIFSLRTIGGNIGYRYNGEHAAEKKTGESDVPSTVGTLMKVYFKYNIVTHKFNVTVNNTTIVDKEIDLSAARGLGFYSGGSNTRTVWVDNLVICSSELSDSEYVEAVTGNVEAYNTAALALKTGESWAASATADALTAAKSTADSALGTATTKAAADEAMAAYKDAVHQALSTEYLERLQAAYPAADYNTGEGSAYDTAIEAAETAFNAVNTLEGFATTYAAQNDLLAAVPTKADESHALMKVIVVYENGESQSVTIATIDKNATNGDLRDADTITLDSIKAACTAPTGKYVAKVYKEATKETEVGANYVLSQTDGTEKTEGEGDAAVTYYEVTLYAVLGDKAVYNIESIITKGLTYTSSSNATVTVDKDNNYNVNLAAGSFSLGDGVTAIGDGKFKFQSATLGDGTKVEALNYGGGSQSGARTIEVVVEKACTIKVEWLHTSGTESRGMAICTAKDIKTGYDTNEKVLAYKMLNGANNENNTLDVISVHVAAGTYYINASAATAITNIIIEYDV